MSRVLVVDDEKLIVKGLKFSLEQDGHEVECAYDGEEALDLVRANEFDIVLLDVMLPKVDGFEVCRQIREFSMIPIIMLTAKGDDMDKILGLDYGADDYITKPFNVLEVKARIKAILRRMAVAKIKSADPDIIHEGDLTMEKESRRVTIAGRDIKLTIKEFEILRLLINNPNKIYSRDDLLKAIWDNGTPADARTVDVHVRRLREKIEINPSEPQYVFTRWGAGYYYKK